MTLELSNDFRVLIHAPSGRDGLLAASLLQTNKINAQVCRDNADLLDHLSMGAAVILLSSETLTRETISKLSSFLATQPQWSDISIILIMGSGSKSMRSQQNQLLGSMWNATLLERPVRAATLLNTIEIAIRARKRQYTMRDHLVERTTLEHKLESEYRKQFRIAETLQRSMINVTPMERYRGVDVETLYLSAKDEADVGGDFYDVFPVTETKVAIVVGDVSGKGLEAASKSLEVKFPLRVILRQNLSPSETLRTLNRYLLTSQDLYESQQTGFVCLTICCIDTERHLLTWSSAGLEGPFVINANCRIDDLSRLSPPIGVMEGDLFEDQQRPILPDEIVLMFTDGISEARNETGFFGTSGVAECLQNSQVTDLASVISTIIRSATEFSDGVLADDVCIVGARTDGRLH